MTTSNVFAEALSLPSVQREELALLLLDSLPDDDDSPIVVSAELEQEIERRIAAREAGVAKSVDLETFATVLRAAAKPPSRP